MSALALDLPLSPELVLVSPPEEASRARELLPDVPAAMPTATRAGRLGIAVFSALCAANCLTPFALSLASA